MRPTTYPDGTLAQPRLPSLRWPIIGGLLALLIGAAIATGIYFLTDDDATVSADPSVVVVGPPSEGVTGSPAQLVVSSSATKIVSSAPHSSVNAAGHTHAPAGIEAGLEHSAVSSAARLTATGSSSHAPSAHASAQPTAATR